MGVSISAGTIARLLGDSTGCWAEEAEAIHQAGLASGPWVATDQTSTRVDGQNGVCHVVGNRLFTSYHTRPGGTRQDVLAVLWGQELRLRLNDEAVRWLEATSLPASLLNRLVLALPWERELTAAELQEHLTAAGVRLGRQQQQQVGDAMAVAAYHAQSSVPTVAMGCAGCTIGATMPSCDRWWPLTCGRSKTIARSMGSCTERC